MFRTFSWEDALDWLLANHTTLNHDQVTYALERIDKLKNGEKEMDWSDEKAVKELADKANKVFGRPLKDIYS